MIESGRINLHDHVMHVYVHLTKKIKLLITNISFVTLFIEQNSTHDCCFRFFIYKNPSALAYQGCQQSPYNKDNNKLN